MITCVDDRSMYLYIVLGGYLCFLGTPSVQSGCTLSISASYLLWQISQIQTSVCYCRTWIWIDIFRFYEEQCQPWARMADLSKTVNRVHIAGGGVFDTICSAVCHNRCDSSTTCRLCRLEPSYNYLVLSVGPQI